jgi:putative RecB family exonuclease
VPEYSISQLDKFEQCALQYKFIYVDGIKRYEEGVEAFLGQRFHEAMEWLYRERAFRVVPLEELLEYYEKAWAGKWHDGVKINKKGRTGDEYRLMGRRFIEGYYKRHHPFDEGTVMGLEQYIRFPLDDTRKYNLKGIIDRLMLAPDGAFEIHDYKTGSKLPKQAACDREMRSQRTAEALDGLRAELARLIDKIEATTEYEPHESALCGWCSYWDLCPKKAQKSAIR